MADSDIVIDAHNVIGGFCVLLGCAVNNLHFPLEFVSVKEESILKLDISIPFKDCKVFPF